jgi:hypothetical protein
VLGIVSGMCFGKVSGRGSELLGLVGRNGALAGVWKCSVVVRLAQNEVEDANMSLKYMKTVNNLDSSAKKGHRSAKEK